jgi:hypothetical protein
MLIAIALWIVGTVGYRHFVSQIVKPPAAIALILDQSADPIKEANQYFAYGRYAQAVQILESAILADPTREDLKSRLSEMTSAALSPVGISAGQYAVFALLIVTATFKSFDYEPWYQIAGSAFFAAAIVYLAVSWAKKLRA